MLVLAISMESKKSLAQNDTCLNANEMHNVNLYRIGCEKCKMDLDTTKLALKDSEERTVSQDHSLVVVVGASMFLLGGLIGSSLK